MKPLNLNKVLEGLTKTNAALDEKKEKREAVKKNAKEKSKVKALTDKEKIAVIWEYLGLDE